MSHCTNNNTSALTAHRNHHSNSLRPGNVKVASSPTCLVTGFGQTAAAMRKTIAHRLGGCASLAKYIRVVPFADIVSGTINLGADHNTTVIHMTEHPLTAIPRIRQIQDPNLWKTITRTVPYVNMSASSTSRALHAWFGASQLLDYISSQQSRLDTQSVGSGKDSSKKLYDVLQKCTQMTNHTCLLNQVEKKQHGLDVQAAAVSWDELDGVDTEMTTVVKALAIEYGYQLDA